MAFYTLTRPGGPWDYPSLGFTAVNGAVLNGSTFSPPLVDPPDAYWAVGGAAESGVTRWGQLLYAPAPAEPATGSVLVYDAVANESNWVEGDDMFAPGTSLGDAITGAITAGVGAKADRLGANMSRFLNRSRAGWPVKIVAIGDSILEGTTVTSDGGVLGTDDALPRVAAAVTARFGNTVTTVNVAKSGHTAMMGPLSLLWNDAITEAADLYLIDYGTNDWSGNDYATPVPGYRTAASLAALERLFRRLRNEVPKADIAFLIANPYSSADSASNNVGKKAYNKAVADVCAAYGVEVIDGYAAFMASSNRAGLMADSTHPNTAGHTVLAAEVMAHLPAGYTGPSASLAPVPAKGLRRPEEVDLTLGDSGVQSVLVPTASTWVEVGTWAADGSNRVTSTPGSSFTCTVNAVEFYAMLSTTAADNAVVTIKRDGTTIYASANLTLGKQGTYWVPLITVDNNLTPLGGTHTFEVVLVSGTLRVTRVGWLRGNVPAYNSDQDWQTVAQGSSTLAIASSGTTYLTPSSASTRITWPTDWVSAKVRFAGYVNLRTNAATTTPRRAQVLVRLNGVVVDTHQTEVLPSTASIYLPPVTIACPAVDINSNRLVSVEVSMVSTDKTLCELISWDVQAHLVRLT